MIHVPAKYNRRLRALEKIYNEIADWNRDSAAVPRLVTAVNPLADVVIIGEAIGPDTVRRSGVNYFRLDGCLGHTGRNLEEILQTVGLTLYPQQHVRLRSGAVIDREQNGGRRTVYCTDLCPEYPGYAASKRARPTQVRIRDALSRAFLVRELTVIRPKVILLLGVEVYLAFSTHFLKRSSITPLRTVVEHLPRYVSKYREAVVIPFWHPSPASPTFQQWLKNFRRVPMKNALIRCIRGALAQT